MRRLSRGFLIAVSILDGLSGLVCGVLFIASPDGRLMRAGELLAIVQELPLADVFFRDFTWIGIAMILVLGIPNTIAAVMLLRRRAKQYTSTLVAGVLLLLWTGFELVFMFNAPAVAYFAVGVLSIACSVFLQRQAIEASA